MMLACELQSSYPTAGSSSGGNTLEAALSLRKTTRCETLACSCWGPEQATRLQVRTLSHDFFCAMLDDKYKHLSKLSSTYFAYPDLQFYTELYLLDLCSSSPPASTQVLLNQIRFKLGPECRLDGTTQSQTALKADSVEPSERVFRTTDRQGSIEPFSSNLPKAMAQVIHPLPLKTHDHAPQKTLPTQKLLNPICFWITVARFELFFFVLEDCPVRIIFV